MSIKRFIIGDIHGCQQTFESLLARIGFSPSRHQLWLTGDLVNRGPRSLEVIRYVMKHEESIISVLGNHDLHLICCQAGLREQRPNDTLREILSAPDAKKICAWLRERPLLHSAKIQDQSALLVHAGIHPSWSFDDCVRWARLAEECLCDKEYLSFLPLLYREESYRWQQPAGPSRESSLAVAAALRIFCFIRSCREDGTLHPKFNGPPAETPEDYYPWYAVPRRTLIGPMIYFGHWAAMGCTAVDNVHCLDSGCAWGRELSALALDESFLLQEPNLDGATAHGD